MLNIGLAIGPRVYRVMPTDNGTRLHTQPTLSSPAAKARVPARGDNPSLAAARESRPFQFYYRPLRRGFW